MINTRAANKWFLLPRPNDQAKLRLFCFPYAGGGAVAYRGWANHLSSGLEICLAQLPGREARLSETALTSLSQIVGELAQNIRPYLDKPFVFFGHSMGASIGFELARQLKRVDGVEPKHLFISARRAPQLPDNEPPIYNLPDKEFLTEVMRLNGTPREVLEHEELMLLMLPLLRADFAVSQTHRYVPEPSPLSCPITAIGGLQDHEISRAKLEGWSEQTSAAFNLRMLPGDHFYLKTAQGQLLQIIERTLTAEMR
jgi:medium-chain acyl-[acyl-carrier-protein] hydrolase